MNGWLVLLLCAACLVIGLGAGFSAGYWWRDFIADGRAMAMSFIGAIGRTTTRSDT